MHIGRIETPEDNLPIDNAFHFLVRVQDQMPSLIVGNPDDTLFVRTAIRTGLGRPGAVVTATSDQITDYEEFIGHFDAINSVEVRARVNGYLDKVNFKDGDEVEKGADRSKQALTFQASGKGSRFIREGRCG